MNTEQMRKAIQVTAFVVEDVNMTYHGTRFDCGVVGFTQRDALTHAGDSTVFYNAQHDTIVYDWNKVTPSQIRALQGIASYLDSKVENTVDFQERVA